MTVTFRSIVKKSVICVRNKFTNVRSQVEARIFAEYVKSDFLKGQNGIILSMAKRWRIDTKYGGYVSLDVSQEDKAWELYYQMGVRLRKCDNIHDEGIVIAGLPLFLDLFKSLMHIDYFFAFIKSAILAHIVW